MVLPRWLAHVNKRTFNPIEIRRGVRPVLVHRGRSTGRSYRTPLDAHPFDGGYAFIPMYGPRTDWVKNVLAAGEASLLIDGRELPLTAPRIVKKRDIWSRLPASTKVPAGVSDDSDLLCLDVPAPSVPARSP